MKIHRFIGDFDLSKKEVKILNPENIKQIKDVLRIQRGGKIILSDGKGTSAEVTLDFLSSNIITGTINKIEKKSETERRVNLYLAILKKENFELAVQKAVECGVFNITPVITERTIKTGLNIPRLHKIILEASEQCGRSTVPVLSPISDFPVALAYGSAAPEKIIFHLCNELYKPSSSAKSISILIGPEGGFSEKEINLAKDSGYVVASLGHLTLRAETAAIIATYQAVKGI